jgi:hypothetical protein
MQKLMVVASLLCMLGVSSNSAMAETEKFQKTVHYFQLEGKQEKKAGDLTIVLGGVQPSWSGKNFPPTPYYLYPSLKRSNGFRSHRDIVSHYGVACLNFYLTNNGGQVIEMDDHAKVVVEFKGKRLGAYDADSYLGTVERMSSASMEMANIGGAMFPHPSDLAFQGMTLYPDSKEHYLLGFNAPSKERGDRIYWTFPLDSSLKSPLIIRLYSIPVKVDASGKVTKRANFTWKLYHAVAVGEFEKKKQNAFASFLKPSPAKFVKLVSANKL